MDQNPQDTRIYIDLNNNGLFTDPNELVFQLLNTVNPSGSFIIPQTTLFNTPLRMRIISDVIGSNFTSCGGIQNGQAEDYTIRITRPQVTFFSKADQTTCSGDISFQDISNHNPNNWFWDFGDPSTGSANTSTQQHPTHTFSNQGTYTIKFKSCNNLDCDSTSQTIYVLKNPNVNLIPGCTPFILYNYPIARILSVKLADIDNSTNDSSDTYFNYTCNAFTNLVLGNTYQVNVTTEYSYSMDIQIYIDFNNDGQFHSYEKAFNSTAVRNHIGPLVIPQGVTPIRNTLLRMRVMSSSAGQPSPLPCGNRGTGETEDYAVMILDPTGTPETNFNDQLKLYPNPSNGTFSLEIPSVFKGEYQLEVQNLIGQKVAMKTLSNKAGISKIDLSQLSKGIYLVKVFNQEFSAVKKIVIE